MDLSKLSNEELMRMRDAAPAAPAGGMDLSKLSNEQLLKLKPSDDPTGSFWENVKAGAGKVFYDLGRGAGQLFQEALTPKVYEDLRAQGKNTGPSLGETIGKKLGFASQADIDEAKKLDEPLMATAGGKVGNIVGTAALLAPTALAPAAATPMGGGVIGGAAGLLQPTVTGESRAKNAALGTAVGGATQVVANKIGSIAQAASARSAEKAAGEEALNATRDAALKAGRDAGYVVPPASVKPGLVNETIESVGGKISTAQTASIKNQRVTDQLAREYIGMKPDAIMTKAAIADAKNVAAEPYRQIAKISPEAQQALDAWKQANFEARMQWNYFRKSGNPQAFKDAQAAGEAAGAALDSIEQQAMQLYGPAGKDFVDALKAARVQIAKISTVEGAMTKGGHVDAGLIAKMGERLPLSDQLKVIADFAGNFPKAVQPIEKIGSMAHALRPSIGAAVGTVFGGPVGAAVGGAAGVAGPWTVRQLLLSGAGQAALATPTYGAGATRTVADLLANPATRALLPQAVAGAALQHRAQQ